MSYVNLLANQVDEFLSLPNAVALDIRDYQCYSAGHLQGAEHADGSVPPVSPGREDLLPQQEARGSGISWPKNAPNVNSAPF